MRFTCYPNLMFLASPWLEIYKFSNWWSFCWLWAKLKVILLTLKKSKFTLCVYFNQLWASHSYLIEFGQDITPQKIIQTLSVWQKIQEPPTRPDTSHLQLFNQQKPRTGWVSQSLEASKAQIFLHTEISFKSLFFFFFDSIAKSPI